MYLSRILSGYFIEYKEVNNKYLNFKEIFSISIVIIISDDDSCTSISVLNYGDTTAAIAVMGNDVHVV